MFQKRDVEKIETRILYSILFFWKSCSLWDNVEKYCSSGEATDNLVPAQCMLDT